MQTAWRAVLTVVVAFGRGFAREKYNLLRRENGEDAKMGPRILFEVVVEQYRADE